MDAVKGLPPIMNKIIETEIKSADNKKEIKKKSPSEFTMAEAIVSQKETTANDKNSNEINYSNLANMIKDTIGDEDSRMEFSLDEESEKMILKIIDNETDEVVRQLPPEITLKIAKIVAEMIETKGQVMNARV